MPATGVKAPAKNIQARQRAIAPYSKKLEELYTRWIGAGAAAGPLEIRLYESLLTLDPWESERIGIYLSKEHDPDDSCSQIIVQGVALLLKSASDIDQMMSAADLSEERLYALQAELMLDTAIGMALLREAQKAQSDLVLGGETARAKKLSRFQHKLRNSLADVKKMIGESERERADLVTDGLTDEPRQEGASLDKMTLDSAAARAAEDYERLKVQKVKQKTRAALSKLPSRTDLLIYGFLLSLALWLGAVKLPQVSRMEPHLLTLTDFQGGGIFLRVDAKPPSLFMEVDAAAWSRLNAANRLKLIETTGSVLAANGYTGVLLRTERNRPLAQWLRGRGATLIESDEAASGPAQPGGPDAVFIP
jgi:hypothetical protein